MRPAVYVTAGASGATGEGPKGRQSRKQDDFSGLLIHQGIQACAGRQTGNQVNIEVTDTQTQKHKTKSQKSN